MGGERVDELLEAGQDGAAMLRAISDATSEAIVIIQQEGLIVSVNPAGAKMFGYEPGELIGRSVLQIASPDWRDMVRGLDGGREDTYEAVGLRKDGSTFRAEVRTRNVRVGARQLRAGIIRDFSQQDELERQREASISLLRATIEATADGLLVVDRKGRIVLHNAQFRRLWAIPENTVELIIDERAISFVEKQLANPAGFRERIATLYRTPEAEGTDLLEFRDGRTIERYTRPQRVGKEIIGRVWSFRDVTQQRQAARALELSLQMRDEFLAIASHELFTPLTSLGVAIRGLRDVTQAGKESAIGKLSSAAERQVVRITRLVQELLDVTRIDGGRMSLDIEDVELGEVARDVLERFAPELDRDDISFVLEVEQPLYGRWDRSRIEQVITNLLSNAIKFGRKRPIEVRVRSTERGAELAVRDHGIGVAPEQQALIFERFQRAVSSRHFAGLGLGLYITRQIVEAHGGQVGLDSQPGEGATFRVVLPLAAGGGGV